MKKVIIIDRGDHFEVIGDYTGAPRIAALSAQEWKDEYAKHPSFETTRADQAGSFADVAPVGIGRWKKDWSGPYKP